jgi:hypothetical protein
MESVEEAGAPSCVCGAPKPSGTMANPTEGALLFESVRTLSIIAVPSIQSPLIQALSVTDGFISPPAAKAMKVI